MTAAPHQTAARTVGSVAHLVVLSLLATGLVIVALRPATQRCERIGYAIEVSAPDHLRDEFRFAAQELGLRTGLVFEEVLPEVAELKVEWAEGGVAAPTDGSPAEEPGMRTVAYASGAWAAAAAGAKFLGGTIDVDATWEWSSGLSRGGGLAAVLVHELGHIVGLSHSDDESSFMSPMAVDVPRQWTAVELEQLAAIGRHAGCQTVA